VAARVSEDDDLDVVGTSDQPRAAASSLAVTEAAVVAPVRCLFVAKDSQLMLLHHQSRFERKQLVVLQGRHDLRKLHSIDKKSARSEARLLRRIDRRQHARHVGRLVVVKQGKIIQVVGLIPGLELNQLADSRRFENIVANKVSKRLGRQYGGSLRIAFRSFHLRRGYYVRQKDTAQRIVNVLIVARPFLVTG